MKDTPTPTTSLDDEWCSINAAARRLGVTPTAIRNRIKRGTLEVRNGNFGKLVRVPLTVPATVTLAPEEPARETMTLTPEERVSLTVTLTVLRDHIAWLKDSLTKAEGELEGLRGSAAQLAVLEAQGEALHKAAKLLRAQADEARADRDHWRERAERLAIEAATVPRLKATVAWLRVMLETEQGRLAEARAERDRLRDRPWWQRLVNG
jgi:hypothetical protein